MQELNFKFNAEQVNIILAGLGKLPHEVARSLIDFIVNTANQQLEEKKPISKGAEAAEKKTK